MNFHTKISLKKIFCQTVLQGDSRSIFKDDFGRMMRMGISAEDTAVPKYVDINVMYP